MSQLLPEYKVKLEAWLLSENEMERRHARAVLGGTLRAAEMPEPIAMPTTVTPNPGPIVPPVSPESVVSFQQMAAGTSHADIVPDTVVSHIPVAESIRATRLGFKRCWFSTSGSGCGCSGVQCHLLNRVVTLHDCVSCLRRW